MGLRIVSLSQISSRARRIKITEGDNAPSISFSVPSQNLLEYQLGLSVGIHRLLRIVLTDRDSFRRAIDCGGRGEDKIPDLGRPQDLQHGDSGRDILLEEKAWVTDGFRNQCLGGEVKDHVKPDVTDQGFHARAVANI